MATTDREPIYDLSRDELTAVCRELGQPRFRADQIWRWLYVQRVDSWDAMANVPKALREELGRRFSLDLATLLEVNGEVRETRKLLVRLPDGERVEVVLIPATRRRTVCVSCQVGCKFGCTFCASGQAGFLRDLTAGEIVVQVLFAAQVWGEMPTNVVFMGIGEPFDNYNAVLRTVRVLNDGDGLNIGARRITISTCGVTPGIERLADEGLQVELSISLHTVDDTLRSRLMPVNRRYPLAELLPACARYFERTKRIVTFEYTLIKGVNDGIEQARRLAQQLRRIPCRVNLIPLSPVEEYPYEPSPPETAQTFIEELDRAGIHATLRMSKGSTLKAACGQLRFQPHSHRHEEQSEH